MRAAWRLGRVTVAFWLGLALAVTVGLLVGGTVAGPLGAVLGAASLGMVVGLGEARDVPVRGALWVVLTGCAAAVAWLAGSACGFALYRLGFPALGIAAHGPVSGVLLAAGQASLLGRAGGLRWFVVGAAGWGCTLGLLLIPDLPMLARFAALLLPGLATLLQRPVRGASANAHGLSNA